MKENIEKLGQIIDFLRERASDPSYEPFLIAWLKDPAEDSYDVYKLLALRNVILSLNEQRAILLEILEDEVYDEDSREGVA